MKAFYFLIIFSVLVTSSNLIGEEKLNNASHKIFLNEIQNELKIFRIDYDQKGANIHQSFNNSILLINISSRRNNFEEVIMLSLGVIGKYLANRINEAVISKTRLFIPTVVTVNCNAPFSREDINILTFLDSKILIQFGNGHISAQELWSVAKNSVKSSTESSYRCRLIRFNTKRLGVAFGRAYRGASRPCGCCFLGFIDFI